MSLSPPSVTSPSCKGNTLPPLEGYHPYAAYLTIHNLDGVQRRLRTSEDIRSSLLSDEAVTISALCISAGPPGWTPGYFYSQPQSSPAYHRPMVGRSGEDHERSRSLRHPSSSSESPLPPIIRHHYSSEDRSDSQRASRPFSVSTSPPTSSNSTPRREFGESHKLSSQTEWIRLPSVSHALQQ